MSSARAVLHSPPLRVRVLLPRPVSVSVRVLMLMPTLSSGGVTAPGVRGISSAEVTEDAGEADGDAEGPGSPAP